MSEEQKAPESLPTARQKLVAVLSIYIPHSHGPAGAANAERAMQEAVTEFEAAIREDERLQVIERAALTLEQTRGDETAGEVQRAAEALQVVAAKLPDPPPVVPVLDVPAGTQLDDVPAEPPVTFLTPEEQAQTSWDAPQPAPGADVESSETEQPPKAKGSRKRN